MAIKRFGDTVLLVSLLLPVQFLLGIWVNLFVTIPDKPGASFFTTGGGIVLAVHMLNALTIATVAIVVIFLARKLASHWPLRLSILATLFVFLAVASGITFAFFGQNNAFSYTMAIGLVGSVVSFSFAGRSAIQLVLAQRAAPKA